MMAEPMMELKLQNQNAEIVFEVGNRVDSYVMRGVDTIH